MCKLLSSIMCLILISPGFADVTVFNSDAVISSDYEAVAILGNAHVSITGGTIGTLYILNTATVDFSDGAVEDFFCYDQCKINISGPADIGELAVYGDSVVTLDGGVIFDAVFRGNSILTKNDGIVNMLTIFNKSICSLYGGTISDHFGLCDDTKGYIYGGAYNRIASSHSSKLYIGGGSCSELYVNYDESFPNYSEIHIYGVNLSAIPYGGTYINYGILQGEWLDGSSFNINIITYPGGSTYPNVILHEAETMPTPTSESEPTIVLSRFVFKSGKNPSSDSLMASGTLNNISDIDYNTLISASFNVEWGSFSLDIPIKSVNISKGKTIIMYQKSKSNNDLTTAICVLDIQTGVFKLSIKKANCSLQSNQSLFKIKIGDSEFIL